MRFLLFIFLMISAASGKVIQKTYQNGQVFDIRSTADGGFIVTGRMKTNSNDRNYLMKFDSAGQVSWLKTYNDLIEFYSYGVNVIPLPGEGYLCSGVMFHDTISNEQLTLLKCDLSGNLQWSREFGNPNDDDELNDMILVGQSVLLAGHTTSMGAGGEDFLIVETDTSGSLQRMRSFGEATDERCSSLIANSGGYVAGGNTMYGSNNDLFLLFLDSTLNIVNAFRLDIPGNQTLYDMIYDPSGDLILAAANEPASQSPKALFLRFNPGGNVLWCKELDADASIPYRLGGYPGGILAAGSMGTQPGHENAFVLGLDANGMLLRQDYFGDSSGLKFRAFDSTGDTVRLAGTLSKAGASFPSLYLAHYVVGDTACNHFTRSHSLNDVPVTVAPVNWQHSDLAPYQFTPVVVTLNASWNDSVVCDYNPYAGVQDKEKLIQLAPNPASEKVTIQCRITGPVSGRILNYAGTTAREFTIRAGKNTLDLCGLPPGIYTVIFNREDLNLSERLIIQR